MAISQTRYIDVKTILKPQTTINRKELIGRFFTSNKALTTGAIVEYDQLLSVAEAFGTESKEYKIASKYFRYLSKSRISPSKISFANFNPDGRKCSLTPISEVPSLASLKGITDGSIKVDMGGVATDIVGLDFSSVNTLSDVATILQTAIKAIEANGDLWKEATVTFVANIGLVLQGGKVSEDVIGYSSKAESGTDISNLIGWSSDSTPVLSNGSLAETVVDCLTRTTATNSNFGSFAFIDPISSEKISSIANWNAAQGVQFMYSVAVNATNYNAIHNAVSSYEGTALTYGVDDEVMYMPMAIMAATNYDVTNGTINYMFTQFENEQSSVTSDSMATVLDSMRINYYGQTQTFGQKIAFYQRGYLQGNFSDMSAYSNECWLKSAIESECLSLFLARNKLPANESGKGILRGVLQNVINDAVKNGTISVGKTLSNAQKASAIEIGGAAEVATQIELHGYWLGIDVVQVKVNGVNEYHLQYTLVYSKGDSVRKIVGFDIVL